VANALAQSDGCSAISPLSQPTAQQTVSTVVDWTGARD
jgi:hypothetical protein